MIVLGWGKPLGFDNELVTAMHAVVSLNDGGAFVTACNGRWWTADSYVLFIDLPGWPPPNHQTRWPIVDSFERTLWFEPCLTCLVSLRDPRRAAELERARRDGIELLKQSEVW